jgi:hypothetical protein
MATSFTDFHAERGTNPAQAQAGTPQAKPKSHGFLIDNISTLGGILGGVGGGLLGTAAGGFGAIPGAAIGSGAGSALGQTLENFLTGEDDKTKDVLKEGLLGAAFGAGPIRGAKFALDAGKGLIEGSGKALLDGTAKQVIRSASDDAAKFTLRGAAGQALTGKSTQLATKQFGLTDKFIADYTKKYGEDAGKTLTRYGINTADDAAGAIGKQQDVFNKLVESAGDIPKTTFQNKLNAIGQDLLAQAPSQQQAMGQKLLAETDQLVGQFGDKIPATALNKVRQQYDGLVNYESKMADPASYGVNKRVADALRETIQGATGNKQLKETGMELSRLRTLQDEIDKRAPQVASRASSPLGFRNMMGAAAGGAGAGLPGAVAMGVGTAAINSPTGRRLLTSAAINGGQKLIQSGEKAGIRQMSPLGTATRIGGLNALSSAGQGAIAGAVAPQDSLESSLTDQSMSDGSTNNMMDPSTNPSMNNPMSANMDGSYQQTPQSSSPYSKENLLADINRDPQNAAKYINYYSQLDEIFNPPAETAAKLNSTQIQQANTAQSGIDSLNAIGQTIRSNPNAPKLAALPGGSLTQSLTGTGAYSAATANAIDAIGRLRSGGAINADEEARFRSFLPAAFDDPQTIQYKLQTLNGIFNRFANPQATGSNSLEGALTQGYN